MSPQYVQYGMVMAISVTGCLLALCGIFHMMARFYRGTDLGKEVSLLESRDKTAKTAAHFAIVILIVVLNVTIARM